MSFLPKVKRALQCRSLRQRAFKAELYGMLLFGKTFSESKIVLKPKIPMPARE